MEDLAGLKTGGGGFLENDQNTAVFRSTRNLSFAFGFRRHEKNHVRVNPGSIVSGLDYVINRELKLAIIDSLGQLRY